MVRHDLVVEAERAGDDHRQGDQQHVRGPGVGEYARRGPDLDPELRQRYEKLQILDSIEFAVDAVVPGLKVQQKVGTVAIHPVCSTVKMALEQRLIDAVQPFCDEAIVPAGAGCCGFAGDRGFLVPELTASATREEAAEVLSNRFDGYYSSSRTCEIGMSRATSQPYRSFWYLLEEASSLSDPPKNSPSG